VRTYRYFHQTYCPATRVGSSTVNSASPLRTFAHRAMFISTRVPLGWGVGTVGDSPDSDPKSTKSHVNISRTSKAICTTHQISRRQRIRRAACNNCLIRKQLDTECACPPPAKPFDNVAWKLRTAAEGLGRGARPWCRIETRSGNA
jgi:hypothetical protein